MTNFKDLSQTEVLKYITSHPYYMDEDALNSLKEDSRPKVQEKIGKWLEKQEKEHIRYNEMCKYENELADNNVMLVCGVDEVGRGPLAGPVVAGAVILPPNAFFYGLNDSKKVTEKRRYELEKEIKENAIAWGIGYCTNEEIDQINILQATLVAMRVAVESLTIEPQHVLVDALTIPGVHLPQTNIVHGDASSVSIAAASIIAKCYRDRLMMDYDKIYPEYGFASNKGYGSKAHIEAIEKYGQTPIHRKSFVLKK